MKARLLKKVVNTIYDATTKGDFKSAYSRLQKMHPGQQRKVLNIFNQQALEKLGVENGASLVTNFAGYRGLQQGLEKIGGTNGLTQEICNSMNLHLTNTIEKVSQQVICELPKSRLGWAKLMLKDNWAKTMLKDSWAKTKDLVKRPVDKLKKDIKNKVNLQKNTNSKKSVIISKNIPSEYKAIFADLEGKTGQEFVDTAYGNMVNHMKLNGIAPKRITINGNDGVMSVTGGYDYINNTIKYSQGFLEKLTPQQQINLISHELTHCKQFSNILRTENIGVNEYAKAIAKNSLKKALDKSSLDFMLKNKYEKALEQGKGEEFTQKIVDSWTKQLVPKIETNFSEVLKLPKIKASSPEGIKAVKDFNAMKNYEGLDMLSFGSQNYRNNPLEVEAYNFGDNIEKLFKKFIS